MFHLSVNAIMYIVIESLYCMHGVIHDLMLEVFVILLHV